LKKAFRNNDQWKLVAIAALQRAAPGIPRGASPEVVDASVAYIHRYEADRTSIFVGNLPVGITEEQIKEIFEPYGPIVEIILRESVSKFDGQSSFPSPFPFFLPLLIFSTASEKFCFAFVQFRNVTSINGVLSDAVSLPPPRFISLLTCQGTIIFHGKILRISQKNSETGGFVKLRSSASSAPAPGSTFSIVASSAPPSAYSPSAYGPAQQQASPVAHMAPPPAYGSPFGYYGSPYPPYYYPAQPTVGM
jgi:hypothetical protein